MVLFGYVWFCMALRSYAQFLCVFINLSPFLLISNHLYQFWSHFYMLWPIAICTPSTEKSFTPRVLKGFKTARIFANNSKMKDTKQNNIHPDNSKAEKNLSGTMLPNICNKGWGGISRCVWCVCDYNLSSPACWENDIMAYLWLLYTTTRIQTHN